MVDSAAKYAEHATRSIREVLHIHGHGTAKKPRGLHPFHIIRNLKICQATGASELYISELSARILLEKDLVRRGRSIDKVFGQGGDN